MDLVLQRKNKGNQYKYVRTCSDQNDELKRALKGAYHCQQAEITSSGLNAISVLMNTLLIQYLDQNVNIIYADEMYCDSGRLIKHLKNIYHFYSYQFQMSDHTHKLPNYSEINNADVNIILTESCSNPNGIMFNYECLKNIKNKVTIIDNTWLTHVIHNPLQFDADYVIMSLTKYYSAGKCICGAIVSNQDLRKVNEYIRFNGLHVSPVNAQLVTENMANMKQRLTNASEYTIQLLDMLKQNQLLCHLKINHPYVRNVQLPIYPSVLTITIPAVPKKTVMQVLAESNLDLKTSFGDQQSRFDPYPTKNKDESITIRLSVGYDEKDIDSLYEEIINVIKKMSN